MRVAGLRRLWLRAVCFLPALVLLLPLCAGAADSETLEYPIKAAYLYKFGNYVDWPKQVFANAASPLNLCVVGDDPFGPLLDKAVEGQQVDGRSVALRRLKTIGRDSGCHILYLGIAEPQRAGQALDAVRGEPILVVSDARSGAPGMIQFVLKDNRVRFNIDDDMAHGSGLTISSKLLALAVAVKSKSSGEAR
ncbi:MAG: YfiR family protein [Burkholderiaceae bacterium]|nr:YfiR family protein [Burkholderiaceae bacterium]